MQGLEMESAEKSLPLYRLSYLTGPTPQNTFLKINLYTLFGKGPAHIILTLPLLPMVQGELWSQSVHSETPAVLFTHHPLGRRGIFS